MVPGLAGPKLDGQMLPPNYLSICIDHLGRWQLSGMQELQEASRPAYLPPSQGRRATLSTPRHTLGHLPICQSRCSGEALVHGSPNGKVCSQQKQAGCHHTVPTIPYVCWKLGKIFSARGKVGPELFYLASSSREPHFSKQKAYSGPGSWPGMGSGARGRHP